MLTQALAPISRGLRSSKVYSRFTGPALCQGCANVIQQRWVSHTRQSMRSKTITATNMQIAKLVPRSGRVDLIDSDGIFHKSARLSETLQSLDLRRHKLQIVRMSPTVDDEDPLVTCKVVEVVVQSDSMPQQLLRKKEKKQKERELRSESKEVPVSWNISPSDLAAQKRKAVESVLSRGYTLQLVLAPKRGTRRPEFTDLEVEKRRALIARCQSLCEEYGVQSRKPDGDIYSRVTLIYAPKTK